jgi:hypothetical protein
LFANFFGTTFVRPNIVPRLIRISAQNVLDSENFFSVLVGFFFLSKMARRNKELTLEDVRAPRGFDSTQMNGVTSLDLTDGTLTELELQELVQSRYLTSLESLDLSHQPNVADEHLEKLSKNETFARLERINLSGTNVSDAFLDDLLNGPVGSVRYYIPPMGSTNSYEARIDLYVTNTRITKRGHLYKKGFKITMDPNGPFCNFSPIQGGLKVLKIQC